MIHTERDTWREAVAQLTRQREQALDIAQEAVNALHHDTVAAGCPACALVRKLNKLRDEINATD